MTSMIRTRLKKKQKLLLNILPCHVGHGHYREKVISLQGWKQLAQGCIWVSWGPKGMQFWRPSLRRIQHSCFWPWEQVARFPSPPFPETWKEPRQRRSPCKRPACLSNWVGQLGPARLRIQANCSSVLNTHLGKGVCVVLWRLEPWIKIKVIFERKKLLDLYFIEHLKIRGDLVFLTAGIFVNYELK